MSESRRGPDWEPLVREMSRRSLLRGAAAGGMSLAFGGVLSACGGANDGSNAGSPAQRTLAGEDEEIRRGGRLRVGIIGGGNTESLDFNKSAGDMDLARAVNLFEGLTDVDPEGKTVNVLAEEMTPNRDGSVWTVRLRDDVVFHDGKRFDAEDVVYSLKYILDPKNKTNGAGTLADLDPNGIRRRDARTVELRLKRPNTFLPEVLTDRTVKIFAADGNFDPPNGTGPFKFQRWTRGERSLFVRHDDYRDGLPYLDELELISVNEPNARVNALQSKQIDAVSQLDLTLVDAISSDPSAQLLESDGANYTALMVEVDSDPFTNNDVRQALRYAMNREQMIENVLRGRGRIGNDLPCWFDPDYAKDIPQREHDPERARSLLQKAGHDKLRVTLHTSDAAPAMFEQSTLYAEQAKAAGITVDIERYPTDQFFATTFLKVPFAATNWGGRPLASQINVGYLKTSPFNETNFADEQFEQIIAKAFATTDQTKRRELMIDAQQILWDRGGTLIWGFLPILDALAGNVRGIKASVIRSLGNYDFRRTWLVA